MFTALIRYKWWWIFSSIQNATHIPRFCKFVKLFTGKTFVCKILHTRYKIEEKQEVTEKSLDVVDALIFFHLAHSRVILLYYTRNAVAMKNEIDMRNVLLGTFNNPIASILLWSFSILQISMRQVFISFYGHINFNADIFNVKNNTKRNTVWKWSDTLDDADMMDCLKIRKADQPVSTTDYFCSDAHLLVIDKENSKLINVDYCVSNASFFVRLIRVSWSVSLLSFSRSRNVTKTRSSSPFWHSGVFEYVLAVTDHSFELFFRRIVNSGTPPVRRGDDEDARRLLSFFLILSFFSLSLDNDVRRVGRRNRV